jgi:hypothetical protein
MSTDNTPTETNPQDIDWNVYEVFPEDDGYDTPKNPYSQH